MKSFNQFHKKSKWKYAIIFHESNGELYHMVLYENIPKKKDLKHLYIELYEDEDFGCYDMKFLESLSVELVEVSSLSKEYKELIPEI